MLQKRKIPQLRRKLALLIEHDHYANLEGIALAAGTTSKTLQSWADSGSDGLTPGLVSVKGYPNLIKVFGEAIRRQNQVQDVGALIKGETRDLGSHLKPASSIISFGQLIEKEATKDSIRFYKRKYGRTSLVKKRNEDAETTDNYVQIGEEFRMVFKSKCSGSNCIILQTHHQDWGFTPSHYDNTANEFWMPDPDHDGMPDYTEELNWFGINRFIAIQSAAPFPTEVNHAIETGISPDNTFLQRLADFYLAQPQTHRSISLFTLEIKPK